MDFLAVNPVCFLLFQACDLSIAAHSLLGLLDFRHSRSTIEQDPYTVSLIAYLPARSRAVLS
jgi:hypothetical protein